MLDEEDQIMEPGSINTQQQNVGAPSELDEGTVESDQQQFCATPDQQRFLSGT
jgi:hypothetical protein